MTSAIQRSDPAPPRGGGAGLRAPAGNPVDAQRRRIFLPFVLPAVVVYVAIFLAPVVMTVGLSLFSWRGSGPLSWRGLDNYAILFQDNAFQIAFVNTLELLVVVGGAVFLFSFALIMVLRQMAARRTVIAILFFPSIVSSIVLAIVWGYLFQSGGLVNSAIQGLLGVEGPRWLDLDNRFNMIMIALTWIMTGFYVTILMAGVDRIPSSLYEDAEIAGASPLQHFRFVTLPLMWDVVSVAAVLWTINSIKIFDFIVASSTGSGLPPLRTWDSAVFVYGESFGGSIPSYQLGYASAAAFVMLLLVIVFVVVLRRLMRREAIHF